MDKAVIVIPARYRSERFPGKVLFPLLGKPVLQWVYEAAKKSGIARDIIVATEDRKVMDFAAAIGARALMTSEKCKSGSDRVWEAARTVKCDFIINLQADEPFITHKILKKAMAKIKEDDSYHIATACAVIKNREEIENPNCVKIAMNSAGRALYFSRSPVPYHHELSELRGKVPYYKHCGFYIYRKKALETFVRARPAKLELLERLEQLRAMENGMNIAVAVVESLGPAIDVPGDIKRAEKYYRAIHKKGLRV